MPVLNRNKYNTWIYHFLKFKTDSTEESSDDEDSSHIFDLAPKTQLYYQGLYDNFIKPHLEFMYLKDLRGNKINKFYNILEKNGATPDMIFKTHKALRACLNKAYKWEYTDIKIMDRVISPKEPKPDIQFWEPPTIKKALIDAKDSNVYYHM